MNRIYARGKSFVNEIAHGFFLKGAALASRGAFLLLIVPHLLDGELAQYVFLSSIAALAGRVLSLGLEEQLPLRVGGQIPVLARFASIPRGLYLLQLMLLAIAIVSGHSVAATCLLTVCYVNTSYLAGLVRTVHVVGSERLRDLHWPIFVLVASLSSASDASELLLLMAISLIAVQTLELVVVSRLVKPADAIDATLRSELVALIRLSWRKLLAGAGILLCVRGAILWPKTLGLDAAMLDEIAFALLLGEAFWQVSMVLVYRRYARYCQAGSMSPKEIFADAKSATALILLYTVAASVIVYSATTLEISLDQFSNWLLVSQMILFFGSLSIYILLRYVVWVIRDFDWWLVGLEVGVFLTEGLIIAFLPSGSWLIAFAATAGLLVLFTMMYVRFRVTHPKGIPT